MHPLGFLTAPWDLRYFLTQNLDFSIGPRLSFGQNLGRSETQTPLVTSGALTLSWVPVLHPVLTLISNRTIIFCPPLSGGLDLDSRSSGCARLGGGVGPPLGVVVEEVAVLVVLVRRGNY